MKFNAKNLRINSMILIVLTVLSAIFLVGMFLANEINVGAIMEKINAAPELANIFIVILIAVCCLMCLFTIIVSARGLRQADGKCDGKANVILATILLILKILSLAAQVYCVVIGQLEVAHLAWVVIFICFLVPYIMCAKNVK